MNSTRLALLALIVGLFAGVGAGFVLGGKPHRPVAAHETVVGRSDSASSVRVDRPSASNDLAHVSAQAAAPSASGPSANAYDGAARSASSSALGRVEATPSGESNDLWTATISGIVLDGDGNALEGATVVAGNTAGRYASRGRGTDTSSVGRAYTGPADVNAQLELQAKGLLASRHSRRTATSDASGRFEVTGLRPGRQSLSAHHEGLVFSQQSLHTGEFARFIGRPVALYHLDVRLPDGTTPPEATITTGNNRRQTAYRWTVAEPVIRLRERSATLTALAGNVEATNRSAYTSDYSSKERTIDLDRDGDGPHVIEVESRQMLSVTVEDVSGLEPPLKAWVKVLKAEKAEGVDIDEAFDDAPGLGRGDGQAYVISDLDAGAYVLAGGRGDGPPEVTSKIELGEGLSEQHLVLGEVDMDRFLVAHCSGPSNKSLVDVSFRHVVKGKNGSTSGNVSAISRAPGEFWLPYADLMGDHEWTEDTELEVTAEARGYGKVSTEISQGQKALELTFQSACDLTVRIDGDTSIGFTVSAMIVKEGQDANNAMRRWSRNSKKIGDDGEARLTGLQPGLVRVVLRKAESGNRGWSSPVDWQELTVRPGDNEVTFVAPTFHDVVVHAPDMNKGDSFMLQRKEGGNGGYFGRNNAQLDATHRATFKGVAAGEYVLQTWASGSDAQMTISVPTGEVLFQPQIINAFAATNVEAGKLGAKGGLLSGDVVVAVNGKEFESNDFYQRLWLGLKDGTVSLSIYRGNRPMNLTLGPAEKPDRAWDEMGVSWKGTTR